MYLVTVEFSKEILFSWNWIQKRCDSVLLCSHITSALAECKCTVLRPDCACKFCHANHVSGEGFSVLLAGAEQGDRRRRKFVRSQGHSVSFPELKESPPAVREVRAVNASCGFFQKGWMGPQERRAISGFCNSAHCNEAVGKTLELSTSLGIRKTTRAGRLRFSVFLNFNMP